MAPSGPTLEQQKILETLVGLPFVALSEHPAFGHKVVGELSNGSKIRAEYVEELFNAALLFDAIDGSGAYRRTGADETQLEVLAIAERLYGSTLELALPKWLAMPKVTDLAGTGYQNWGARPRVLWPKATPHVN
jgi:hypothetical protein